MERRASEEQARVIGDLENNLILFASAGTGKTFTVANRIGNILRQDLAKPEEILCLTFTTKACDEMRADVVRYVGEKGEKTDIRTIHGFCYRLMREENRLRGDRFSEAIVCDEVDAEELLRSILSSQFEVWEGKALPDDETFLEFDIYRKKDSLRSLISALKHIREEQNIYTDSEEKDYLAAFGILRSTRGKQYAELLSFNTKREGQVRDEAFEQGMQRHVGKLAASYDNHLRQSNRADYDDLIIFASRYLREKEVRERWEKRYRYIIVDEMQDTSLLEYSVLRRIFGKNNVMMCGDFFQSIYEWRGSKPDLVLGEFIKEFSAKTYMFSQNYRSTQTLTEATFGYLKASYPSLVGKYCPEEIRVNSLEQGGKILCMGFDNRREEGYQIYKYLQKIKKSGTSDVCVMARTNGYLAVLARAFEEYNAEVPEEDQLAFVTAEDGYQFYKNPLVKDLLAVIKLILNRHDRISLERIAQKYVKLVGVKTIEDMRRHDKVGASIVSFIDPQAYFHKDPYHVLIDGFKKGDIVVYDTETTGLDLGKDEMVQLSAVRIDQAGNVIASFDKMILPTVPIERGAYETHGFDLEYIRAHNGVSAKEALEEFSVFVKGCVLVGHNSYRFDSPLIRRQLLENGLPPLDIVWEYDTLAIAKQFLPDSPDFRLSTLCGRYSIVNEAAHNAYGDIVATGKVLLKLIQENVMPTQEERRTFIEKHLSKFEKLYAFLNELTEKMHTHEEENFVPIITERMRIHQRVRSNADKKGLRALDRALQSRNGRNGEVFLRELILNADMTGNKALVLGEEGKVPLLTVHQAKGCEFDVVVLAGVDDRNFPAYYAKSEREESEERKVFYVAITRAKQRLVLTRAAYNGILEVGPSPYVAKIPEEFLSYGNGWF